MAKLELKHLAGYLPYRLKVRHQSNITMEMTCERLKGDFLCIESIIDGFGKPILRPLSDLTKEIEVNGEKFVPIEWLEDKYYTLDLHKQCLRLLEEDGENWIYQCDYMLVEQLLEWHFDIYGLIPELAIDINTLNK
jgi:hypothetical protein